MNNPPMQITILPAGFGRNYFDVIAQQIDGKLEIAEGLGWDEMLGVIDGAASQTGRLESRYSCPRQNYESRNQSCQGCPGFHARF